MNKAILIVLILQSTITIENVAAQQTIQPDDFSFSFGINSYQLEAETTTLRVLGPTMGLWGQLGVSYGTREYAASTNDRSFYAHDLALSWYSLSSLLTLDQTGYLAFFTEIKLGQTRYDRELIPNGDKRDHTFSEVSCGIGPSLKPAGKSWFKAISLTVGVGIRSNYFSDIQKQLTVASVDNGRTYPSFNVDLHF